MDKRKYLLDQLAEKTAGFKAESEKHKRLYRRLRYAVFLLTSLSALLAGLSIKFPEASSMINVAILFVSAAIGALTSIEGLRKPSELWIHERTTYYSLMDLKREVEFEVDHSTKPEVIEQYFCRMQHILCTSNEKWSQSIVRTPHPQNGQTTVPNGTQPVSPAGVPPTSPGRP